MLMNFYLFFESYMLGEWIYDFHKTHVMILIHMDTLSQGLVISLLILILLNFQYFRHDVAIMFKIY
jgi:hypothetical protein